MDRGWSQRRNAPYCVVDFDDGMNGKIVDIEMIEKEHGSIHGNCFGPSNVMEMEGVRRLVLPWKPNSLDNAKVSAYVHNWDGKTHQLIPELLDKPELLERNHNTKFSIESLATVLLCRESKEASEDGSSSR
jgi:hypothetical protein